MSEITRYTPDMDGSMEPDDFGNWVRYEDIAHLLPDGATPGEWASSEEVVEWDSVEWDSSTEWEAS